MKSCKPVLFLLVTVIAASLCACGGQSAGYTSANAAAVGSTANQATGTSGSSTGNGGTTGTGSSGGTVSSTSYKVSGTVTGLNGTLKLDVNDMTNSSASTTVTVTGTGAQGSYTTTALPNTDSYSVVVDSQPTGVYCTLNTSKESGALVSISSAEATMNIACSTNVSLKGIVFGLTAGQSVTILDSGANPHTFTTDGTFDLPIPLSSNGGQITIGTQASAEVCSIVNTQGVPFQDVLTTNVACVTKTDSILGTFYSSANGTASFSAYYSPIIATDGNFYGVADGGTPNPNETPLGYGLIYQITPTGTETPIYKFSGTDGSGPSSSLIQANDGNLYGVTISGGPGSQGVVFKLTLAGVESTLTSFSGSGGDGAMPFGRLIQANDGNLYGTTLNGGAHGFGTIFKVTLAGVKSIIYSFSGAADGSSPQGGLVQASDGYLYGATQFGGASNRGTLFKVSLQGSGTVLHTFTGASTDGQYPTSLTIAANGKIYGLAAEGTYGKGIFYSITGTGSFDNLYQFGANFADGYISPQSAPLVLGSDGNLYGLNTSNTLPYNFAGSFFMVTPAGIETVIHEFPSSSVDITDASGLVQGSNGTWYGVSPNGFWKY